MSKILITGATGQLGRKTVQQLVKVVPVSQVAALARDPAKAADIAALGVEVRKGDYFDYASLVRAFKGIDKVVLVSAHAFTDRFTQHYNVITAAREAGVKHLIYTSIQRREGSGFVMPEVTESDIFSEQTLKVSGVPYTILREPPYAEVMQFYIGDGAYEVGIRVPEGSGKVAPATRDDLAAANVAVLTQPGHEGKTYTLSGPDATSFAEIATVLSSIKGKPVPYKTITDQQYLDNLTGEGFPPFLAAFALGWVQGINRGDYSETPGDLERLIGHKPTGFREYLKQYPIVIPELAAIKGDKAAAATK